MISDVPLGAFLSGGIDSSAIVAMMAKISAAPIKTFSIGFEEKSYSELPYSRLVAEKFKTDHSEKILNADIRDLVLQLAGCLDEPLGDFSNFPTYLVARSAREKVTVALSGDGGDEIFGGYEHYLAQKLARCHRFFTPAPAAGADRTGPAPAAALGTEKRAGQPQQALRRRLGQFCRPTAISAGCCS